MLHLVEIGSGVSEKRLEMFKSLRTTYDERQRTKTDSKTSHMGDSCDLKKKPILQIV